LILGRLAWHNAWNRPQPGERILIAIGVSSVFVILAWMAFMLADARFDLPSAWSMLFLPLAFLVPAVAFLCAGLSIGGAPDWRRALLVVAALHVPSAVGPAILAASHWYGYIPTLSQLANWLMGVYPSISALLCLGIILVLVLRDRRLPFPRGWLHRLGAVIFAAQWAVQLMQSVWIRFLV
jgi:hypothetical protein